eukprot:1253984-Alexandrium_andersonii.AAC.1
MVVGGLLTTHDVGNAAALQLSARHKVATSAARITMPCMGKICGASEPLAHATIALVLAVGLRYAGWLRICAHHRN